MTDFTQSDLTEALKKMVLIREFEEEADRQYKRARIGGYCHLAIGQEATTVGTVRPMRDDDLLITGYRCHGFALAKGMEPKYAMAELFGKETGCSKGRGGSMHLLDPGNGYYGGWGIVAGQLPIAVGLALAMRQQGREGAVICELGDGAMNMGAWHESLNLAKIWELPIVFLVVNNIYGMGTAVSRVSAEPDAYKRAAAYRMRGEQVDGNDFEAVYTVTQDLLKEARDHWKPSVLEAKTYRHRGHSIADAGLVYRSQEEIERYMEFDPIKRLADSLGLSQGDFDDIVTSARKRIAEAVQFAEESPDPTERELAKGMYAPDSKKQFERMLPGSPLGEENLNFKAGLGE